MAKVCLLDSPSWLLFNPRQFLHLGLLYLAGSLRAAKHDVRVLDCHEVTSWDAERRQLLIHHDKLEACDVLGISATTANAHWGKQLAKVWPAKVKVLGGTHATYILRGPHEKYKRPWYFDGFDFMMIEEAEESFVQFCDGFDRGDISKVPNLCWFNELGMLQRNPPCLLPDVTKLPPPAFDLWPSKFSGGGMSANGYDLRVDRNEKMTASLYNSRGCLEAGTLITLASGETKPIEELKEKDEVQCFDLKNNILSSAPIKSTWVRDADDLWELELENGEILRITGEHPVWTQKGWEEIEKVEEGKTLLYSMWEGIRSNRMGSNNSKEEVLLPYLREETNGADNAKQASKSTESRNSLSSMWNNSNISSHLRSRRKMASSDLLQKMWASPFYQETKRTITSDEQRGEVKALGTSSYADRRSSEDSLRNKKGRSQSNEEAGSCREGIKNYKGEIQQSYVDRSGEEMGRRENALSMGTEVQYISQQIRDTSRGDPEEYSSPIQVCRRWKVLDRSLRLWETKKSGLCRFQIEESYLTPWRIFSHYRRCTGTRTGLSKLSLGGSYNLGQRTTDREENRVDRKVGVFWTRLIRKTFIGKSVVYNITVHPYHNYFAGGTLVHNCPYGCRFCADARTKVRNESFEQVEGQIKQLADLGVSAIRIQDDVLTIRADRCKRIADILHDYGMIWRGNTRVNLIDDSLFRYMANKGCVELGFGCEHGSAKMLKLMAKGTTPDKNTEGIKMCQDAGMVAKAFIILGFPGETLETIEELRNWLIYTMPSAVTFSLFQPYPGSDVWNNPQNYGVTLPDNAFDKFWIYGLEGTEDELVLSLPTLSKQELLVARKEIGEFIDAKIGFRDRRRVEGQFHGDPVMM